MRSFGIIAMILGAGMVIYAVWHQIELFNALTSAAGHAGSAQLGDGTWGAIVWGFCGLLVFLIGSAMLIWSVCVPPPRPEAD